MKKQILTTLVTTAFGCAAFAGSWSLDSRADLESTTYNDAAKAAATTDVNTLTPNCAAGSDCNSNYTRFNLQTLRLDGKGNFTDATSFRLRFRLNNGASLATTNARDSLNSAIDFAYIQHNLMDGLSLQLGKFGTDIGGIEGMTSGADLYLTSQAYNEETSLRYATGIKAIYTFADQEISAMVMNESVNADANGATGGSGPGAGFNQTRNAAGIVYKGSFMDKTLSPVLSYHEDNLQPTTTTAATNTSFIDRKNSFAAVGLKYDWAPIFVEVDYHYNTYKNRSIMDETDKTSTVAGTIGYRMENFVAKLKAEGSETEIFSAASTSTKPKYNGYQAAVEYLPTNDKNFRYHVAYVSRDTKPETGDTQTTQSVFVGTRLFADFLK
jgi:hypothetical protein